MASPLHEGSGQSTASSILQRNALAVQRPCPETSPTSADSRVNRSEADAPPQKAQVASHLKDWRLEILLLARKSNCAALEERLRAYCATCPCSQSCNKEHRRFDIACFSAHVRRFTGGAHQLAAATQNRAATPKVFHPAPSCRALGS